MNHEPTSLLSITGTETDKHTVSVEVLTRVLEGMQQLALIFAAAKDELTLQQRFKPSGELRRRFRLRVGVPQASSYALPMELVDEEPQQKLAASDAILPRIHEFISATSAGDNSRINQILPDSRYRDRALRELRGFAPKRGERWSANFSVGESAAVSLNGKLSHHIDRWLQKGLEERTVLTVTGELIGIKFDENKLFIRQPITNRELECSYMPEVEVDIFESRRDLIQVTGEFVLDQDGNPKRLTAVSKIEAVDLSPMEFATLEYNGRTLKAAPPLSFEPTLDEESQQMYVVDDEALDLHAFAFTRDELADELVQHVFFAWDTYALESEDKLTGAAKNLRNALRTRLQETA